jgi:hypothetical protein
MKCVWVPCVLVVSALTCFSLDREAFTFTKYDLNVQIEPEQQRLAGRGTIVLRNDSSAPQKNAALQISSSLTWRSIQADGKPLQFVSQPYTSDIDHTGELSEAIVSLPKELAAGAAIELSIGYEGVIALDATRLTRIGVPKEAAVHSDWDQISKSFTAVRGVGYVTWYPVSMESASLADGNAVFETVGRWKSRHANSTMSVSFGATGVTRPDDIHFSGTASLLTVANPGLTDSAAHRTFDIIRFGSDVPTFVLAAYQTLPAKGTSVVEYLPDDKEAAAACVNVLGRIDASALVGRLDSKLSVLQLPDPKAAPFAADKMLLTPLKSPLPPNTELILAYAYARGQVLSPREWVRDGLGRYAQAVYLRQQEGRGAALKYLKSRLPILVEGEKGTKPADPGGKADSHVDRDLLSAGDEAYLQTKAMYVWWMLNDMLSDRVNAPLSSLMLSYQGAADTAPEYVQRLLESAAKRDLQWFFDDWVYHDRGLPDFRVESAFSRKASQGNYLVTVTIENLGAAGAEVPVTARFDGGEMTDRVEVRGKSKAVLRIATPKLPADIMVNDGSVPESDTSNNVFKVGVAGQ